MHGRDIVFEFLQKWREKGWTAKTNAWQSLSVGRHDLIDSEDLWIRRVAVHGKAVVHRVDSKMARNTSKTEDWERLVKIVWLDDLTNISESGLVLVVLAEVMERAGVGGLAVRGSVVNGGDKGDGPA